jgi:hypothetical protein
MDSEHWIKPPCDMYSARTELARRGLADLTPEQTTARAAQLIRSQDVDAREQGLRILWASACTGNQPAAQRYVREINDFLASSTVSKAEGEWYAEVAKHWTMIVGPLTQAALAAAARNTASDDFDTGEPTEAEDDEPSYVVIKSIGDPLSDEGRRMATRYSGIVSKGLPKRGMVPATGAISAAILSKWPWAVEAAKSLERTFSIINHVGSDRVSIKPILLVGPHGCGKTSLGMAFASMLGRHCLRLAAAGSHDAASLASVARGWRDSRPCAPVIAMHASMSCDPCIVVDELDKASGLGSQNGSVVGTLMGMLDHPGAFHDTSLMTDVDLSHVFFIATANRLANLPVELKDRFQIIHVSRPKTEHFDIVLREMRKETAAKLAVNISMLPTLDHDEYNALRSFFESSNGSLRTLTDAYTLVLEEAVLRDQATQSLM